MQVNKIQQNQSFGMGSPIVGLMEIVDKNFITTFLIQDGLGFVAPRMYEGANRGRERDPETGKRTGPYNWELVRKEGIREILTGPSAFFIPLAVVNAAKKIGGKANNVKTDYIKGFEETLRETFQAGNADKKGFYENLYKKILTDTLGTSMSPEEIAEKAQKYAAQHTEFKNRKTTKAATAAIVSDFTNLKKNKLDAVVDFASGELKYGGDKAKSVVKPISEFVSSMHDYADDAFKTIKPGENVGKAVEAFTKNRTLTRNLTNFGAIAAVAAFWQVIPKLYNMGLKNNPALAGTNAVKEPPPPSAEKADGKQPSFTSAGRDTSFTGGFELSGAVIPAVSMAALLYGTCIPPRLMNAQDKYDRAEILVRDASAFTLLMFGAKALARGFSDAFAKLSGLALNVKPDDHAKSAFTKFRDYFSLGKGVKVLNNSEITSKYSDVGKYKDKLDGLKKFINLNGGDWDKVVKKNFKGMGEETILNKLADPNNILVRKAKNMNSVFGALSTLVLVPGFIIFLCRACENMTKKRLAREVVNETGQPKVATTTEAPEPKKDIPPEIVFNHGKNLEQFLN